MEKKLQYPFFQWVVCCKYNHLPVVVKSEVFWLNCFISSRLCVLCKDRPVHIQRRHVLVLHLLVLHLSVNRKGKNKNSCIHVTNFYTLINIWQPHTPYPSVVTGSIISHINCSSGRRYVIMSASIPKKLLLQLHGVDQWLVISSYIHLWIVIQKSANFYDHTLRYPTS